MGSPDPHNVLERGTEREVAKRVEDFVLSMPAAKHLGYRVGSIRAGEVEIFQPLRAGSTGPDGSFRRSSLDLLASLAAGSAAATLLPPGGSTG